GHLHQNLARIQGRQLDQHLARLGPSEFEEVGEEVEGAVQRAAGTVEMLALLLGERSASRTREELKMPIRGGQRVLQVVAEASDQPSAALGHAAQLLPLPLRLRA